MSGTSIHDRHQDKKSLPQRDGGDIDLPGMALILALAVFASRQQLTSTVQQQLLLLIHLNRMNPVIGGISWIVLRPLIASMPTRALNSRLAHEPEQPGQLSHASGVIRRIIRLNH